MIAAGALPLLVEVLEVHKSNTTICEQAIDALKSIVSGGEASKKEVVAADALPVLLKLVKIQRAQTALCELASFALIYLAFVDPLSFVIVSAGALPVLMPFFNDQWKNVRNSAHQALQILGYNDDGTKSKLLSTSFPHEFSNPNISLSHSLCIKIFHFLPH